MIATMDDIKYLYSQDALARPILTPKEERALLETIHLFCDGDQHVECHDCEARTEFIERNMKLVLSCAKKFVRDNDPRLPDLISEGTIGLMKGVDKFNVNTPYRFSTYGMWWIQSHIRDALAQHDNRIIRHRSYHEQFKAARKEVIALSGDPDVDDEMVISYLQAYMNWSDQKVKKFLTDQDNRLVPVESVAEPEHGSSMDHPVRALLLVERDSLVNAALDELEFEEVYLLVQHYVAGSTYDEIAATYNGLSRERIRQKENEALRKLWFKLREHLG